MLRLLLILSDLALEENMNDSRPRPVLIINLLTAIAEAIVPFVALMGWWPGTQEQIGGLMVLILGVSNALKTFLAQRVVTPIADPRDAEGKELRSAALRPAV